MPYTKCIFETLFILMRKALTILLLVVLPMALAAQTKSITIDWSGPAPIPSNFIGRESTPSETASNDILRLELDYGTPTYTTQWEDSNFADRSSLRVSNVVYGPVSR